MTVKLPLLHDGDAFFLVLDVKEKTVQIQQIQRIPGNTNMQAHVEQFWDIDPEAARVIVQQIKRRYPALQILT